MDDELIEFLSEHLHNAYENKAASVGWETNPTSRVPWSEVPPNNQEATRYAVRQMLILLDNRGVLHLP